MWKCSLAIAIAVPPVVSGRPLERVRPRFVDPANPGRAHPGAWLSSHKLGRAVALASKPMKVFIGLLVFHCFLGRPGPASLCERSPKSVDGTRMRPPGV